MSAVLVRKAVKWKRSDKLTLVGRAVFACIWWSESSVLVGSTGHTFSFLYDFPCLAILAFSGAAIDLIVWALALSSVWVVWVVWDEIRARQDCVAVNALAINGYHLILIASFAPVLV